MGRYTEAFRHSIEDPEGFWGGAVQGIDWYRQPSVVLDKSSAPLYRWFTGGVLNTCFNALDRHVRDGRGDQAALIYDSPVTGASRTFTYRELLDQVARFAGVLAVLGWHRRPRGHLHADGPRGGHRHARLRAYRRRALGGVRRLRRARSWQSASTMRDPKSSCRLPAGSKAAGSSSTSRSWTGRSACRAASRGRASSCSAPRRRRAGGRP